MKILPLQRKITKKAKKINKIKKQYLKTLKKNNKGNNKLGICELCLFNKKQKLHRTLLLHKKNISYNFFICSLCKKTYYIKVIFLYLIYIFIAAITSILVGIGVGIVSHYILNK